MHDKLVMLVENNKADEKLAMFAFKKNELNQNIVIARDGVEALIYLLGDDHHEPQAIPDLIILDLKMPRMNGFEVLRHIRGHERTHLIPVIILSSSLETQDLIQTYGLGANSYIRKPIDLGEFSEIVYQIKNYWFTINHPPPHLVAHR
jgi:two-component system, response regulator